MDDLALEAGKAVLGTHDPLIAFMLFTIGVLVSAVGVLYLRNQKQNDDTTQLVKDGHEQDKELIKILTVLSERFENAIRSKNS